MSPASPAALVPLRGRQAQACIHSKEAVSKQRVYTVYLVNGLGDFLKRRWLARWQQRLGSTAFKYLYTRGDHYGVRADRSR